MLDCYFNRFYHKLYIKQIICTIDIAEVKIYIANSLPSFLIGILFVKLGPHVR